MSARGRPYATMPSPATFGLTRWHHRDQRFLAQLHQLEGSDMPFNNALVLGAFAFGQAARLAIRRDQQRYNGRHRNNRHGHGRHSRGSTRAPPSTWDRGLRLLRTIIETTGRYGALASAGIEVVNDD